MVNTVDLYNSATGIWTTATLSVARQDLAATSVGNFAMFAGGISSASLRIFFVTAAFVLSCCFCMLRQYQSSFVGPLVVSCATLQIFKALSMSWIFTTV